MLDGSQMTHRLGTRNVAQTATKASKTPERVPPGLDGKLFEEIIEKLSASFVRVPVGEIGTEIDRWIKEIAIGLNFDRGALARSLV